MTKLWKSEQAHDPSIIMYLQGVLLTWHGISKVVVKSYIEIIVKLSLSATRHQACLDQVQRLKGESGLSMTESILHNQSEFKPVNTDLCLSGKTLWFNST